MGYASKQKRLARIDRPIRSLVSVERVLELAKTIKAVKSDNFIAPKKQITSLMVLKKLKEFDRETIADFLHCYVDFANIFLTQNIDRCYEIARELLDYKISPEKYPLPFYMQGLEIQFNQIDQLIPDWICQKINNSAIGIEIDPIWPTGFGFDNWRLSGKSVEIQVRFTNN